MASSRKSRLRRTARENATHAARLKRGDISAAYQFIYNGIDVRGIARVLVGLDSKFQRTIPYQALRGFIRERIGMDIGFDVGDEAFSAMVTLALLGNDNDNESRRQELREGLAKVAEASQWHGRFRFFQDENGFAADADCTGVAISALYEAGVVKEGALLRSAAELLRAAAPFDLSAAENLDSDTGKSNGPLRQGVVMVYWEDGEEPDVTYRGKKQDAVVACNALYALKLAAEVGLADPDNVIEHTFDFIVDHLVSGAYRQGTRYYPSPDTFLFFLARICARFTDCKTKVGEALLAALRERSTLAAQPDQADNPMSAISLAQRVAAMSMLGEEPVASDETLLRARQETNGSWPICPFYTLGRHAFYFGSATLTTVFAIKALQTATQVQLAASTATRPRVVRAPSPQPAL